MYTEMKGVNAAGWEELHILPTHCSKQYSELLMDTGESCIRSSYI